MKLTHVLAYQPDVPPALRGALLRQARTNLAAGDIDTTLLEAIAGNLAFSVTDFVSLLRPDIRDGALDRAMLSALRRPGITDAETRSVAAVFIRDGSDAAERLTRWATASQSPAALVAMAYVIEHAETNGQNGGLRALYAILQDTRVPVALRTAAATKWVALSPPVPIGSTVLLVLRAVVTEALESVDPDDVDACARRLRDGVRDAPDDAPRRSFLDVLNSPLGMPDPGTRRWYRLPTTSTDDVLRYLQDQAHDDADLRYIAVRYHRDPDGRVARFVDSIDEGTFRGVSRNTALRHEAELAAGAVGVDELGGVSTDKLVAAFPHFWDYITTRGDLTAEHLLRLDDANASALRQRTDIGQWATILATHPVTPKMLRRAARSRLATVLRVEGARQSQGYSTTVPVPRVQVWEALLDHDPESPPAQAGGPLPALTASLGPVHTTAPGAGLQALYAAPFLKHLADNPTAVEQLPTMEALIENGFPGTVEELITTAATVHLGQ